MQKYLTADFNININVVIISSIFHEIPKNISRYLEAEYQTGYLGEKNKHASLAVDEALFIHNLKGDKIWILGIINMSSK